MQDFLGEKYILQNQISSTNQKTLYMWVNVENFDKLL
jgi:hypothetical protein